MDVTTGLAPGTAIQTGIDAMVARLLHVEPGAIDRDQTLLQSGMNSIELIELITRIEIDYGIEFPLETTTNLSPRILADVVARLAGGEPG